MQEIQGIVEIQRKAWDMPDLEIVATFEMKAVSDFGIVLMAVDANDKPVGFIYAFPEFPNYHYSHMMATLPEWQGKGVGFAMKKYHREIAVNSPFHIDRIRWTVDPLLPNNAYLNFKKLGGVCSKYYPDYYGDPSEIGIYKGIPTDRFLLEWYIHEERVKDRMDVNYKDKTTYSETIEKSPPINEVMDGKWEHTEEIVPSSTFSVLVPSNYQQLKNQNLDLAIDWRIKFRNLCIKYFEQGWEVYDYHSFVENNERINFYEFRKRELV